MKYQAVNLAHKPGLLEEHWSPRVIAEIDWWK